jgi:hypothetical protein
MDGKGSESCPMVDFGIRGVKLSGTATAVLMFYILPGYARFSSNLVIIMISSVVLYRESNLSLDRPARNLFAHAGALLAAEPSLSHPMLAGISR